MNIARHCTIGAPLVICTSALAGGPPQYTVTDLGVLPDIDGGIPHAINNAGEAVGYMQEFSGSYTLHAWVWRPDTGLTRLPPPAPYSRSVANDITDSGIIVGRADSGLTGETHSRGWIWEEGEYTLLPPFPGSCDGVVPEAINEHREVVGRTCLGGTPSTEFYWSEATGFIDLGDFGIHSAYDINDDGVVAAGTFDGAARWTLEGGVELLGTLPPPHDDSGSGYAINQAGDVAGISVHALTGPDSYRAFLYSDDTGMVAIAPTTLPRSIARGINASRDVVGTEGNDSSSSNNPWVWPGESPRFYINDVVSHPDFGAFEYAADINDSGQILLIGHHNGPFEPHHPVILTPIVEGDVNQDGSRDVDDLVAVIMAWGPCPAAPAGCPADMAPTPGDGVVNVDDLVMVIVNWSQP